MRIIVVLLGLLATVSACAGGTVGASSSGTTTTGCTSLAPPVLAYPQSGSASVNPSELYFYYPTNPAQSFTPPVLTPSGGGTPISGNGYLPPSPSPTTPPGILPPINGDQTYISGVTLAAHTTYTVTVSPLACASITNTLGSFTTQ